MIPIFNKSLSWFFILFFLGACGGGGGGDGGNGGGTNTSGVVDVTGSTPYNGSVGTGISRYVVKGLTPSTTYNVVVYNVSADISLATYVESGFLVAVCSSNEATTASEICITGSNESGEVYIEISGANTASGGSFTFDVLPMPQSEGTVATPLDISGQATYSGSSGISNSYYVVTGLTPGQIYTVGLSDMIAEADLYVHMHKDMQYATCSSENADWAYESCDVAANFEGKLYIEVNPASFGAYYTISINATANNATIFEGYDDAPIDITGQTPYAGQLNFYSSYYSLGGLTPGVRYEVRMNNASADFRMWVFGTPDYVNPLCTLNFYGGSVPARRSCVAQAPAGGTLYIQMPYLASEGTYELDAVLAPVAEGSATTPMDITMPYNGQVDTSASYYVVSGLTADWNYEVVLTQSTATTRLQVGSEVNTFGSQCATCVVRTNSSGELYIKVSGADSSGQGSWFTLDLAAANNPEGSMASPVSIPNDASHHQGQVDDRYSYYQVSGLTPNSYYMVHMDANDSATAQVYSDSAFSNTLCQASVHCLAPVDGSGELYIRVNSSNGIYGATYDLWVAPSLIKSEGTTAPMDITGALLSGTPATHAGQVSNYSTDYHSYYVVSGLSGSTDYTVSITDMTDNVQLDVFGDAGLSNLLCSSKHDGIVEESCTATSPPVGGPVSSVELYIRITMDTLDAATTWDGAKFTVTVAPGGNPVVSEGASGAPVDITANLPYGGEVKTGESSYYKITGLNPSLSYAVVVHNDTERLGLRALGDVDFTLSNWLCVSNHYDEFSAHCTGTPNGSGEMYILVEGNSSSDAVFSLDVSTAPVAEGSVGAPLDITGSLPYEGQAEGGTTSDYRVSGLTPSTEYFITLSNHTQDTQFAVYNDSAFTGFECQSYGSRPAESCFATSNAGGELFVAVDGPSSTGVFFTLDIDSAPQYEGTLSQPVEVTHRMTYAGQKGEGDGTRSLYKVTGLVAHSSHRVSLTRQTNNMWIKVYGDANFSRELCYSGYGSANIGCAAAADANGEMYFEVGYISGGYFDVYVP